MNKFLKLVSLIVNMKKYLDQELIKKAIKIAKITTPSERVSLGNVGCALISGKGNIYLGVSMDLSCGIGFCAERNAAGSMITAGETRIKKIIAISEQGIILPPCGVCREFLYQINEGNLETEIIIGKGKTIKLKELLPERWLERV